MFYYNSEEFSFIYSYNSIFHMKKEEIKEVIHDVHRILKREGLFFMNFLSKDDCRYGEGIKLSEGEFLQDEDDDKIIHSYFDDEECEKYFEGFKVIFKEKRITEKYIECKKYKLSYIDYILKKL